MKRKITNNKLMQNVCRDIARKLLANCVIIFTTKFSPYISLPRTGLNNTLFVSIGTRD